MGKYKPREYWEKRLQVSMNLEGVGCLGRGIQYNTYLYNSKVRALERGLREIGISDLSSMAVLDVGVGTGFWIDYCLKRDVRECVGVDFAEASIEYLSQKYSNQRPKFLHSDISSNNLPHRLNKQFDIIIAFDVFYHIAEDELLEKAMDNLDRVLVPYGWLIFTDVLQIQEEKTGKYQSHVKWRSRDHWISILSKRGFDVKTEIPMFVFLHSAITGSPVLRRCVNMFHYKITPHLSELPWIGQIYLSVLSRCDDFLTKYTGTSLYIAFAQKGGK